MLPGFRMKQQKQRSGVTDRPESHILKVTKHLQAPSHGNTKNKEKEKKRNC